MLKSEMSLNSSDLSDQVAFFLLLLRGERNEPSLFQCPAWQTPVFACEGHFIEETNPGNCYRGKEEEASSQRNFAVKEGKMGMEGICWLLPEFMSHKRKMQWKSMVEKVV